jgi:hypothetical protein
MSILFSESRYPLHKNKEVLTAWFRAIEKYPIPEGLFTTLVDKAVSSDQKGLKVRSAYLISPGKSDETAAYFRKFMTEYFDIEDYTYEFTTWSTIEEAMDSIETPMPER